MRICILCLSLIFAICGGVLSQQASPRVIDETPYDEWAESPTIELEGCGVFRAVRATVDGRELEARGFIHRGRTHLPARETLERLGGIVTWAQQQRAFYAQFPGQNVTFRVTVGSRTAQVYRHRENVPHGVGQLIETIRLDTPPMICEGMVYAPIRAAVEASGGRVHFDRATRMVHITTPPGVSEQVREGLQR